jgi:hypothetical protein
MKANVRATAEPIRPGTPAAAESFAANLHSNLTADFCDLTSVYLGRLPRRSFSGGGSP